MPPKPTLVQTTQAEVSTAEADLDVMLAYETVVAAKYTAQQIRDLKKQGKTMPDGSYPIGDCDDAEKAVHAVGRGNADHDAIRRHIIKNTPSSCKNVIPDNWNNDGSIKAAVALDARPPMAAGDGILDGIPFTIPALAMTNTPTGDGRIFREFTAGSLPMPLMAQFGTSAMGGHDGAVIAGKITQLTMNADGTCSASGVYAMTDDGVKAATLAASQMLTGVSVDCDSAELEVMGDGTFDYSTARIRGATQTPFPAFMDAQVVVTQSDIDTALGLVASGTAVAEVEFTDDRWRPPAAWFADPELEGPTALTFTPEGQIVGHLALWDSCHTTVRSETGECLSPPESLSGYRYFNVGQIETDDGQMVACGALTYGTAHAAKKRPNGEIVPAMAAVEHYANSGHIGGYIRCGQDAYGIWAAGAIEPDLDAKAKRQMLAAKPSGDWRMVAGSLELVGALMVPKPAFPVPSLLMSGRDCVALVAAGAVPDAVAPVTLVDAVQTLTEVLLPLAADRIVAGLPE